MLRQLVLLLLLANAAYVSWSQGWLAALGPWAAPQVRHEPQRLQQQVQPERMLLTNSANPAAAALVSQASDAPSVQPASPPATEEAEQAPALNEPTVCLQMGVLNDKQVARLRPVLDEALAANRWVLETSVQPARWIVYSGKLANADALATLRTELRRLKVEFRDVGSPALQPGLALGTYSSEAAAQQALRDMSRAGVKGAKVAVERPETNLHMARLPRATAADKAAALQAVAHVSGDPWPGKTFQACP